MRTHVFNCFMKTRYRCSHINVRIVPLAFSAALVCGSGFAQVALPSLAETVVTATRSDTLLHSLPVGATVLLGADIVSSGMLDANEAIRVLGGVAFRNDLFGGREAVLDLRGFGERSANNTVILIDGIRISENEQISARLSSIAPESIERIEIVRGGSSVLWGEGATAGVINVITKTGSKGGLAGLVQLSAGTQGTNDLRLSLDGSSASAQWSLQGRNFSTDGYRLNYAQKDETVNFSIQNAAGSSWLIRGTVFSESSKSRLPGQLSLAQFYSNSKISNTPFSRAARVEDRVSIFAKKSIGDFALSIDWALRQRDIDSLFDFGGGYTEPVKIDTKQHQVSPRVQYVRDFGQVIVTALGGIDWLSWDSQFTKSGAGFPYNNESAQQQNSGRYLQIDAAFPAGTRIVGGLRREAINQNVNDTVLASDSDRKFGLDAWELGVNQDYTPSWGGYFRASKSFRVANVDDSRYNAAGLLPQLSREISVGVRFKENNRSFGVQAFRQTTRREIGLTEISGFPANVNLDSIRRIGLEMQGGVRITDSLEFVGAVQWVDAKFVDGLDMGKRPPHVSPLTASILLKSQISAEQRVDFALVHRSKSFVGNDFGNKCDYRIPENTTLDVSYLYTPEQLKGWSFQANVRNLTDRRSYSWAFANTSCSALNVYPDFGRSFVLNAKYRF